MSDNLHPGLHPDVESLNAFIEGVLPEHERLECLAHLAECSRCREIVYLAQEAAAVQEPGPVRVSKPWFARVPVLVAAAAACLIVFSIGVYRFALPEKRAPEQIATLRTPAPENLPQAPAPLPAPKKTVPARRPGVKRPPDTRPDASSSPPTVAAATPPPLPAPAAPEPRTVAKPKVASVIGKDTPANDLAAISGTVTDATGGVVAGASVTVHPIAGTSSSNVRTDQKGQFNLDGLTPGQYELQIDSPGFRRASKQVDLQPRETAKVDSLLEIGSTASTVEVTADPATLNTQTSSVIVSKAKRTGALPSKLPPAMTVANGKLTLAVDTNGALFLSKNAGRSWKAVKPTWQGKVVLVVTPPEVPGASNAVFQLTTDSEAVWLSRDGNRWYPAPPPR